MPPPAWERTWRRLHQAFDRDWAFLPRPVPTRRRQKAAVLLRRFQNIVLHWIISRWVLIVIMFLDQRECWWDASCGSWSSFQFRGVWKVTTLTVWKIVNSSFVKILQEKYGWAINWNVRLNWNYSFLFSGMGESFVIFIVFVEIDGRGHGNFWPCVDLPNFH